ncbi:MAG: hypothetical protein ACP5N7_06160 [Candidatus Pacearchaeota archaeon]
MNFKECKEKGFIENVKGDKKIAHAVYKLASKKLLVQSFIPMDKDHVEVRFTLFFDSLTQFLDSLALEKGYRILTVDAYFVFMKDVLKENILSKRFAKLVEAYKLMKYEGKLLTKEEFEDHVANLMELLSFIGEKYFQSQ